MLDPVEAVAGAEKPVEVDNMSSDDFIQRRIAGGKKEKVETPPPTPTENPKEAAPTEPTSEAGTEGKPPEDEGKDVLSKAKSGNLDDLSEEELGKLANALGSRAVARFGELTAKRRQAEERVAALEAALARREQDTIANTPEPIRDNPYAAIKDAKELSAKAKELKEVIDFAEERLDEASDIGPDDIAATVDGKEFTKKQLRENLRRARKARDEYLPDVARRLAVEEQSNQLRSNLEARARKELPWMEDKEDERRKRYDAIVSDPRLAKIKEVAPDVAAQMPFFLAHAANSMFARREIPLTEGTAKKATPTPPENPASGAASSRSSDTAKTKQEKELKSRFDETGSRADWVNLRTTQLSKRKRL